MSGRLVDVILRFNRADQPLASETPPGSVAFIIDENINERVSDDGTTWESWSGSGAGSGTVTNTGTLTADTVIVGNGGVDVKALALGTALQVLRVNAGATGVEFAAGGAGDVTASGTLTSGSLIVGGGTTVVAATTTGTGVVTALGVNVGSAGAVVVNGGALGTPSSGTGTNLTGIPISTGISGLGANVATFLATPSSANLAAAVTGETGSGALMFGTSPSITTDITIPNTGLHLLDTNASHDLIVAPGSDLTADRTLTVTTGDSDRTLTLSGNATISGTNTGDVTLAGTPDYITIAGQVITRNAVDLAADVTGTLPIANGGTGQTTATAAFDALAPTTTAGDVIYHNGTDNVRLGIGTAGQVLTTNAGATAPEWTTVSGTGDVTAAANLTNDAIVRGDGGAKGVQTSAVIISDTDHVTGMASLTLTNTGLHLLDTNASHDLIIAPGSDLSADRTLTVTTGDADRTLTLTGNASITGTNTGDVTLAGTPDYITISGQTITRNAVDLAADVTGALPIANGGTANTTATAAFDALAPTTTAGDLIYHNGTDNIRLAIGTAAQVLKVNAGATAPEWGAASGGGLTYTAGGADADQSMAVNTFYYVDISGYTADRTYTLPGTAAVGDICAIGLTAGDTAFELLITAAAGDTLNGVAGGTEWSRLFITGETVYMTCVAVNSAWVVTTDGRTPQQALMHLSTDADGETAGVATRPTQAPTPGAWTVAYDNANIASTSGDSITPRRTGRYDCVFAGRSKDTTTSGTYFQVIVSGIGFTTVYASATSAPQAAFSVNAAPITADTALVFQYTTQAGSIGCDGRSDYVTNLSLSEIL